MPRSRGDGLPQTAQQRRNYENRSPIYSSVNLFTHSNRWTYHNRYSRLPTNRKNEINNVSEPPTITEPIFIEKSARINEYHRLYKTLESIIQLPSHRDVHAIGLQIEILNAIREETLFSQ